MKKQTLSDALKHLEKKYGAGTVMKLTKGELAGNVETYPTGIYSLDKILGGGFAKGRIVELYGGEGSGKTTMALQVVAEVQRRGGKAAYIDVEHAFDMSYASQIGVNMEELYFSQPDSAEQAMDIVKTLASTGEFQIVVVDSVAALTPATEFEGEVGKSQIGHLARFLSSALKQVIAEFSRTKTTLVLINQLRMKIGVMFGDPFTTPGGTALKYYASQRIAIRKSTKIENTKGELIGYTAAIKIDKNKIAAPFQKTDVPFIHGTGFDKVSDLFNLGVKLELIRKEKITYWFGDEKLGIGEAKARQAFKEDDKLVEKLRKEIEKKS